MEDFTIRQAQIEDKDSVLQIHDHVYDGRDYLPYYYDFLLTCSNATAFVLLHGEKAVSILTYQTDWQLVS